MNPNIASDLERFIAAVQRELFRIRLREEKVAAEHQRLCDESALLTQRIIKLEEMLRLAPVSVRPTAACGDAVRRVVALQEELASLVKKQADIVRQVRLEQDSREGQEMLLQHLESRRDQA